MTDFETHPVGTAYLLKRLRSNTPNMAIGLARHQAAARIEQLEAELTRANAATAAAFEVAAGAIDADGEYVRSIGLSNRIRALATPDQTAALDRMITEAEARVWEQAEQIARNTGTCLMTSGHFLSERCADAILAASKKGGA